MTLIVGIPACTSETDGRIRYSSLGRYCDAVVGGAGALPVLLPPMGEAMVSVTERLDGLLLSGSPSNVEPRHYGVAESLTPDLHDPRRDRTTLPLVREAVRRGIPVLAICRGIQELNVALGGSLHQQVQTVPGRMDHRGGPGPHEYRYRPKHKVALTGGLAAIFGGAEIEVNSLHQQGLDRVAEGMVVEAVAPDGTVEGVRVVEFEGRKVPGWAVGVQWHPEWKFADNPDSVALLRAFGDACRAYAAGLRRAA
jgi:putative glutamine amidotransferase